MMLDNQAAVAYNMISQQLCAGNVLQAEVLELFNKVPRTAFVPEGYRSVAYAEMRIPIGHGQVMLSPLEQGRILQALQLQAHETVLEIGTGTGYLTALLAEQAQHVYSVDIFPEFTHTAEKNLQAQNIHNVTLETCDITKTWPAYGPYDVIVVSGALLSLPKSTQDHVKQRGRIFAILGRAPAMEAGILTRVSYRWPMVKLFETVVPYLINIPCEAEFNF